MTARPRCARCALPTCDRSPFPGDLRPALRVAAHRRAHRVGDLPGLPDDADRLAPHPPPAPRGGPRPGRRAARARRHRGCSATVRSGGQRGGRAPLAASPAPTTTRRRAHRAPRAGGRPAPGRHQADQRPEQRHHQRQHRQSDRQVAARTRRRAPGRRRPARTPHPRRPPRTAPAAGSTEPGSSPGSPGPVQQVPGARASSSTGSVAARRRLGRVPGRAAEPAGTEARARPLPQVGHLARPPVPAARGRRPAPPRRCRNCSVASATAPGGGALPLVPGVRLGALRRAPARSGRPAAAAARVRLAGHRFVHRRRSIRDDHLRRCGAPSGRSTGPARGGDTRPGPPGPGRAAAQLAALHVQRHPRADRVGAGGRPAQVVAQPGHPPPPAQHVGPPLRPVAAGSGAAAPGRSPACRRPARRLPRPPRTAAGSAGVAGHAASARRPSSPSAQPTVGASYQPASRPVGVQRARRPGRRPGRGRRWRTGPRPAGTARPATGPPRPSTAHASSTRVPSTARLRPGRAAQPQPRRAGRHVDGLAEQRDRAARRVRSGASSAGSPGRPASRGPRRRRRAGRGAAVRRARRHSRCCSALQLSRSPAAGTRTTRLRPGRAGLGVDHRVVAGQRLRPRSLRSARMRRALGSAIRSVNWATSAGRPHSASMPETSWLARTRWMPCERPRRARSSSRSTASAATASRPASSTWNSSTTATIRGQCAVRVLGAQLGQLGHLVPLGRVGPAAQLLAEEPQQRQAELAVGVDVDADQPHVRQPARVAPARREPGERHALLEVEQVERQLGGGVAGGERAHPGVDQVGLAGAGRAADQRVRRVVAERHRHRLPSGLSPIGAVSPLAASSATLAGGQQVRETGRGAGGHRVGDLPAGLGDQRGRRRRPGRPAARERRRGCHSIPAIRT